MTATGGLLSEDQHQRLAVLAATRGALLRDEDMADVVHGAHWVWCGQQLEVAGWPPGKTPTEHDYQDAATWRAAVDLG